MFLDHEAVRQCRFPLEFYASSRRSPVFFENFRAGSAAAFEELSRARGRLGGKPLLRIDLDVALPLPAARSWPANIWNGPHAARPSRAYGKEPNRHQEEVADREDTEDGVPNIDAIG